MNSPTLLTDVIVTVKNSIGNQGYGFFTCPDDKEVIVRVSTLTANGFAPEDLRDGFTAVVDMEVLANGWYKIKKIHEINCRSGKPAPQSQQRVQVKAKIANQSANKVPYSAGTNGMGEVKALVMSGEEPRFGFIKSEYADLFFHVSSVRAGLEQEISVGVIVHFDVRACPKGVEAYITDIHWPEEKLKRVVVYSNPKKSLFVHLVTNPTGRNTLEVRNGPPKSIGDLLHKPATRAEARILIGISKPDLKVVPRTAKK